MKHGKAKGKASKASSQKAKPAASSKARPTQSSKASPKTVPKSAGGKADSGGNGTGKRRPTEGGVNFSNPVVGAAFKRAIKKYPNAFRRLTD